MTKLLKKKPEQRYSSALNSVLGPENFYIEVNANLQQKIEEDKYEISFDSYNYEYDNKTIKRGVFYLEIKRITPN